MSKGDISKDGTLVLKKCLNKTRSNKIDFKYGRNFEMTNADKIRNMTNDELADFLFKVSCAYSTPCMMIDEDCKYFPNVPQNECQCKKCFEGWLESERNMK